MQGIIDSGIKEGKFYRPTFAHVLITLGSVPVEWIHGYARMQNPVNSSSILVSYKNMEIGVARCRAVADILAMPEESRPKFILWLSDDDIIQWDGLVLLWQEMMNNNWDVLTSLVHLKNPGFPPSPVLWRWDKDERRPLIPNKDFKVGDVVESHVANLGFGLTRPELFEKIEPPWFRTGYEVEKLDNDMDGVILTGEDCYAFEKIRAIGGRIGVHTGVRSSHLDVRAGVIY